MEVRIQIQNDQASIQFASHHAVVREALEAALPRLRDMLEATGVQLVDVNVSDGQSFAERQQAAHNGSTFRSGRDFDADEADPEMRIETPLAVFEKRGLLDLFA
jgi:flagellar hook-length control protein FliK